MAEYVTRCKLEFNGQDFSDFSGYKENSVALSKPVALMNKSGTAKLMPRYGFTVDAKVTKSGGGADPRRVFNGTFTNILDNGDREVFGGVAVTEVGDRPIDGENEITYTISYSAESRTPDLELL